MEKMKKNKLALALTATLGLGAFAGSAQAINVTNEGIGEFSYIPYFSVTKGQQEQIKLVNTSNKTVAAKIYFRRGTDSVEVRDFNIILSPKDVWVGTIEPSTNGAKISTSDNTCTVPTKSNGWTNEGSGKYSVEFEKSLFGSAVTVPSANVVTGFQSQSIGKILEGYVTVVVMGVSGISTDLVGSIPYLAKHVGGVPRDCGSIDWGFANATSSVISQFAAPTNVLSVSSSLVDVTRGSSIDIPVTTLANAFDVNQVTSPGIETPDERNISQASSDVFVDTVAQLIGANFTRTVSGVAQADPERAISSVITSESVFGTYDTTSSAASSWVVNFPTKKALLDLRPNRSIAPFSDSIVPIGTIAYDDEEAAKGGTLSNFSPFVAPPTASLPYEVNVLTFGSNPLSSNLSTDLAQGYAKGWLQLGFPSSVDFQGSLNSDTSGSVAASLKNAVYKGMPVIGFEYNESPNVASSNRLRYNKNITLN